jgi:hypothetical protein
MLFTRSSKNDIYFFSITISRWTPSEISRNPRVPRNPCWETLLQSDSRASIEMFVDDTLSGRLRACVCCATVQLPQTIRSEQLRSSSHPNYLFNSVYIQQLQLHINWLHCNNCLFQWPTGLRQRPWSHGRWDRRFESLLSNICFSFSSCFVLSCVGRGLCDGLISRPTESYSVQIDYETSCVRRPRP